MPGHVRPRGLWWEFGVDSKLDKTVSLGLNVTL